MRPLCLLAVTIIVNHIVVSTCCLPGHRCIDNWLARTFDFPHRFYCSYYVSKCSTEQCSQGGVSKWVSACLLGLTLLTECSRHVNLAYSNHLRLLCLGFISAAMGNVSAMFDPVQRLFCRLGLALAKQTRNTLTGDSRN
jgi:hypothetical protein